MNRKRVRNLKVVDEEHAMKWVDKKDRLQICQRGETVFSKCCTDQDPTC